MQVDNQPQNNLSDFGNLLVQYDGEVALIALNTPKSINALSEDTLSELQNALNQIAQNSDIRAVIIRTAGDHFCAGHNLKEMNARRADEDGGKAYYLKLFQTCSALMKTIVTLPQPVIAEVRGIATAAGCQLVASCDLAVASDDAKFATSGVNVGLFCTTPMVALSRNISRKQAMEMLLIGDFITAKRAYEMGLINSVVAGDELSEEAMTMARKIAAKSPVAVRLGKQAFYKQSEMDMDAAYDYASRIMAENMMCQDTKAGIQAFIDKKPMPEWTGE